MSVQSWENADWHNANWFNPDWLAEASPPPNPNVAWASVQRNDSAGGEGLWDNTNWLNANWYNPEWRAGVGWRADFIAPIVGGGYTDQFVVPQIIWFPVFSMTTVTGFNSSFIGVQLDETGPIKAVSSAVSNDRFSSLPALQAADVSTLEVLYTPSPALRDAEMVNIQAPQTGLMAANFVFSGALPTTYYGRIRI